MHRPSKAIGTGLARGVLLAGLLSLLLAGCFFQPREAEQGGPGTPISEPAKSPEEVLTKLQSSLEGFDEQQYTELLAQDFRFEPDRADSTDLADAGLTPFADPWGLLSEEDAFNRLRTCFSNNQERAGVIQLLYTGEQVTVDSSVTGYSRFESDYRVGVYYIDFGPPSTQDSLVFDGALKLFIRAETDGSYRIYHWEDLRQGPLETWGFYKGEVVATQDFCPGSGEGQATQPIAR